VVTQDLRRPGVLGRVPAAGLAVQLGLLALLWSSGVCLGIAGWLAGTVYAVVLCAVLTGAVRRARIRVFGLANGVTLVRATLVGCVTAIVAQAVLEHERDVALIVIAAVALVLDGVDGQVARRTGTTSRLGARFDMEVDAFLILVLSVFVARDLGPWVLAIGLMRYAFVAAGLAVPWLRGTVPPSMIGKTVAVAQGAVLVAAAAGVLPPPVATALVALALALLTWSFGRSVGWLWRERRRAEREEPGRPLERVLK
jgi:phosphatidylglycerophosphate synthase